MPGITGETWRAVQSLFEELVDLPPEEQARRLDASPQSAGIVQRTRALLAAADSDGILDRAAPSIEGPGSAMTYRSLAEGQVVGGFTIDRLIGRGGMGEVYLARRTANDFEQRVALKMLRAEAVDRGDLFARERKLLAKLEHPGIARLIDAGVAEDGRPFMAMEYVDGEPIDSWCRTHKADLDTRLRLFRETCDAVAYAHARLVVHRDIKPSNIVIDAAGKPRLLDFGIAKLLDDTAVLPVATQALLTPDYAAPEQLDGEDVSVATDVYALGVLLYELVTGASPWRREGASVPAIIRRVLYEDPILPSRGPLGDAAPVPPARVRGDLDAIIMKAMRRKASERYGSVIELSEDVARHQEVKPVRARGGSTRYMLGRFLRRYRWAATASAAALAALLIGAGGIAWQARQTAIERDLAIAEARRSEAINRMLTVMFRDTANSDAGEGSTVKQMLDQTADRLVGSLDTSTKSAELIRTLFDLYSNLEDVVGADSLVTRALARGIGKGDPVVTAQLQVRAAGTAAIVGHTEKIAPLLDVAEPVFRRDPDRFAFELIDVDHGRAQLLHRNGKLDQAVHALTELLPRADRILVENHRDLLTIYNNLLVYMIEANQLDAMVPIFVRVDGVLKKTGQQDSPIGLNIAQLKGLHQLKLKQPAAAAAVFADIVAKRRARFGRSAGLAVDLVQLGRAQLLLHQYAEASRTLAESEALAIEKMSPTAPPTIVISATLAEAQAEAGDVATASRTLARIEPMVKEMPGPFLPLTLRVRAVILSKQGKRAEALATFDQAERLFRALGPAGATYLEALPALRARIAEAS